MTFPTGRTSSPFGSVAASTLALTAIPLVDTCDTLHQLGFAEIELVIRGDGVWPGHLDPARLANDPDYADAQAAILDNAAVRLSSAGCEMASNLPLAEECRRHRCLAAWLAERGAKLLTIFVYPGSDAAKRWRELRAIANDHGVQLAAETHLGTALAQPGPARELAEALDLTLTLDASHWIGQGFHPADWRALETRIAAVQVRHCRHGELQEPLDAQARGLDACLDRIIPREFTGPIVCEQIANPNDPDWCPQMVQTAHGVNQWQLRQGVTQSSL